MRAWEIILFIIVIQAAVVFTTDIGLFDEGHLEHSEYARNQYSIVNITENLSGYGEVGQNPSTWDYFKITVSWAIESLIMFVKIIFSIIFIFPVLVKVFGVPASLSAFIQVAVVSVYIWGFMQYKSKTGTKHFE